MEIPGLPERITGGICTWPASEGGDGVTARGPGMTIISDRIFDFRAVPATEQDEVISGVDGAVMRLERCLILGGIKALLCGNGDHPGMDVRCARWEIEDCAILGAGRRCPEAQDGAVVSLRRCWIHDWGQAFDVRAFAGWAHRGGTITAEQVLFTQSRGLLGLGLLHTLRDVFNHAGQSVNDYGPTALLRPRSWMPGVMRGLTADTGGLVLAHDCWRNHRWIRVDNCNDWLDAEQALEIVQGLDARMPLGTDDVLCGWTLEHIFLSEALAP